MDLFVHQLNTTVKLLILASVFISFYRIILRMLGNRPADTKEKSPIERGNRKYYRRG